MDFDKRLESAINRGRRTGRAEAEEAAARALTEEELRRLHTQYRLELSEQIELRIGKLPNHFPGFRYETIYGERGWGAAVSRDDLDRGPDGRAQNFYSRLEMTIRPAGPHQVLELAAKATIRNKEVFVRNHYEKLSDVDPERFVELIDLWTIEYAERFAAG